VLYVVKKLSVVAISFANFHLSIQGMKTHPQAACCAQMFQVYCTTYAWVGNETLSTCQARVQLLGI